jgi:hypothetical protein
VDGWAARKHAVDASQKLNALIEDNFKKVINQTTEPVSWLGLRFCSQHFMILIFAHQTVANYFVRLSKEFTVGHELGASVAYTFLERLVETNDTVGKFKYLVREGKFGDLTTMEGGAKAADDPKVYEQKLGKLKMDRLAAHVLGLCVVLSVNYAQG